MRGNWCLLMGVVWWSEYETSWLGCSLVLTLRKHVFSTFFWVLVSIYICSFTRINFCGIVTLTRFKTNVPICPRKKIHGKNVHDSNESLWFFCLDRLLRIKYAFSHYISSFFPHGQSAGFVLIWSFLIWNTFFIYLFIFYCYQYFSVAHVPHHFSLFFFSRQHKHRRYCEWPGGSFFLHSGPPPGGLPPWGEGAPTHLFLCIYICIYLHMHTW